MAERPILLLSDAIPAARAQRGGGGNGPAKLSAQRQQERLATRLDELAAIFEARSVQLQATSVGAVPEEVLVLETAGTVEQFANAVRRIEGFEFLSEFDIEVAPDADFFVLRGEQPAPYSGRVYLLLTNQTALRELQQLWGLWQSGTQFPRGQTKWRDVFSLLRDIRPWGIEDRLNETGILADWQARVAHGQERIPSEIELWFRDSGSHRSRAAAEVRNRVLELGGEVVSEAVVEGIRYHAMSVRLPISAVQSLLLDDSRRTLRLVQSEQIQFFRAAGQMATRTPGERNPASASFDGPQPQGAPAVALLDGLPLQNHAALTGRLSVDDPDEFERDYAANLRRHGTAMASLIIWGDLNSAARRPIPQPLYVRPIMRPIAQADWVPSEPDECVPENVLVVDLVHRAVRRLFEPEGDERAVAPSVAAINFSIGISDRPFVDVMSPLARLLDWLSHKYGVLFVVSIGNRLDAIELGKPWSHCSTLGASELTQLLFRAIAADTRNHRALSPAEAMNALTVGALHADQDPSTGTRIDPLPFGFPSPYSRHGLGYRRSIKPDVLMPGGRIQFQRPLMDGQTRLDPLRAASSPAHMVAAPGPSAGAQSHTARTRGTSDAAALLTRSAAFLANVVNELRSTDTRGLLSPVPTGLILKVLLAHGARWGSLGVQLEELLGTPEHLLRLLGFGPIEITDVSECTPHRVTALGGGALENGAGAEHRFPLPPSLSGKRGWRRITVTLAWFTPVNSLSQKWRQAHLWYEVPDSKLRVNRVGPDHHASQRGTLQHDTFEGEAAVAFVAGDELVVRVSCREDAPGLDSAVPYALAVTLEVAEQLGIDIYAEVRAGIRAPVRVQTGEGA